MTDSDSDLQQKIKTIIVHKHLSYSDVLHNFPSFLNAFYTLMFRHSNCNEITLAKDSVASHCIIYSCSCFIGESTLVFFL